MEPPKRSFTSRKKPKRINSEKYMMERFERLKLETEERSKVQQSIREGQSEVLAKFNAIEEECEQLRDEINQIIQPTADTQIRLNLMFSILKAREQGDAGKDAQLTRLFLDRKELNLVYSESSGVRTDLQSQIL